MNNVGHIRNNLYMNIINESILKIAKRSETKNRDYLVKTFVNVGPLSTIMTNKDHEVIYGRRGTGKTHALAYLTDKLQEKPNIVVNIDLRTLGSNGGLFSDGSLSLSERATRLLIDTIQQIGDGIIHVVLENDNDDFDLSEVAPLIDTLKSSIVDISIEKTNDIEYEVSNNNTASNSKKSSNSLALSLDTIKGNLSSEKSSKIEEGFTTREKIIGKEVHKVHFSSVYNNLRNISDSVGQHIWILFDEWAEIPIDLQPYLAELIRRTILPNKNITVKIAAIEQRTNLAVVENNNRIGIEIGADIAASQNLDEYMVFDNDEEKSSNFFKELLFHHFTGVTEIDDSLNIKTPDDFINSTFTQINTFSEFVRASEGVPRDAINILSIAATKANDAKISIDHIRYAARTWYTRGKEKAIASREEAFKLLQWIRHEVIGERNSRAFLLKANHRDTLIDHLFDARVLHIIKENVSGKDALGVRYNVYSIDYGCYVDLINTANAPKGLFIATELTDENLDEITYIDVPKTDYRAIRRAVLDLDKFYSNSGIDV